MTPIKIALAVSLSLLVAASSGAAAVRRVTPQSVDAALAASKGGDTITLTAGEYVGTHIGRRQFSPALIIDARAGTLTGWTIKGVDGVEIRGGAFRLPPIVVNPNGHIGVIAALRIDGTKNFKVSGATFTGPGAQENGVTPETFGEGYAIFLVGGANIAIEDNKLAGFKSAIVLNRLDGFRLINNEFADMRADAMDLAESRNGVVEGNHCADTRTRGDEHPDCIQAWSRPASAPVSDIVVRKNKIEGKTQGISFFNHMRNGVDDGGFDRITIEDNDLNIGYPRGITMMSGRDSLVRNNRVHTLPNADHQALINVGPGVKSCGNVTAAGAGRPGQTDPAC